MFVGCRNDLFLCHVRLGFLPAMKIKASTKIKKKLESIFSTALTDKYFMLALNTVTVSLISHDILVLFFVHTV